MDKPEREGRENPSVDLDSSQSRGAEVQVKDVQEVRQAHPHRHTPHPFLCVILGH